MKNSLALLLFWLFTTEGVAESSFLEKYITLHVTDKPLGEVLHTIGKQVNCRMAYSPSFVNETQKVSLSVTNVKLRNALRILLGEKYQFKERDEFVIIRRLKPGERLYGGYIKDDKTGKNIENATVYDKRSLKSATTDKYGYYEIVTREPIELLQVSRVNYTDTTYQLKSLTATRDIDISMLPQTPVPIPEPDTPQTRKGIVMDVNFVRPKPKNTTEYTLFSNFDIEKFVKSYSDGFRRADADNVNADLRRQWHWSIAPYVGNNGGLSGSVVNDYSFNLTVGYSKGNRKFEFGGVGNINRGDVGGVQLGTFFNIVNDNMRGLQLTGIINRAEKLRGVQVSGIMNTSDYSHNGWQLSPIYNNTASDNGSFQISGLVNTAKEGRTYVQVAGISNNADTVYFQAGLVNTANHSKGLQIGLLNITDTLSGVVLGLINIVKKGYHVLEVSHNDLAFFNLSFKTGTHRFYITYSGGINIEKAFAQNPLWSIGMGLGTSIRFTRRVHMTFDITNHHFSLGRFNTNTNELIRVTPAFNLQFSKKMAIAIGPTFNAYTFKNNLSTSDIAVYKQGILPDWKTTQSGRWITWFGGYAAVRLF